MKTVRDVCQYIGSVIVDRPLCIETGTMYTCPPGNEPHNTTSNIMEFICAPRDGTLYSLDIDLGHIEFSKDFCAKYDGRLEHRLGDSVDTISTLADELVSVDLLCLDGKEFDKGHMVKEFKAIEHRLANKHFVLVDDIHNPNSVKWVKMVPILKELGYSYIEVPTPTGMFVAAKGYTLG